MCRSSQHHLSVTDTHLQTYYLSHSPSCFLTYTLLCPFSQRIACLSPSPTRILKSSYPFTHTYILISSTFLTHTHIPIFSIPDTHTHTHTHTQPHTHSTTPRPRASLFLSTLTQWNPPHTHTPTHTQVRTDNSRHLCLCWHHS